MSTVFKEREERGGERERERGERVEGRCVSIRWYKTEIIMIQLVKRKRQQNEDIRDKFRFFKNLSFFR